VVGEVWWVRRCAVGRCLSAFAVAAFVVVSESKQDVVGEVAWARWCAIGRPLTRRHCPTGDDDECEGVVDYVFFFLALGYPLLLLLLLLLFLARGYLFVFLPLSNLRWHLSMSMML